MDTTKLIEEAKRDLLTEAATLVAHRRAGERGDTEAAAALVLDDEPALAILVDMLFPLFMEHIERWLFS